MSPVVGFSRQKLESSHYKLVERNKISYIQRINRKCDDNYSTKNHNRETETIKDNQIEILKLKSPIMNMKNLLGESTANLRMYKKESVNLKIDQ